MPPVEHQRHVVVKWHDDLSRSARAFVQVVWPAISDACSGGRVYPIELESTEPARQLDTCAGIDVWQFCEKNNRMRGIAQRVQWVNPKFGPFNTFTTRDTRPSGVATELDKRLQACTDRHAHWLYAVLTTQAYLVEGTDELVSVGICRTRDLYRWVANYGPENLPGLPNWDGSSSFKIVPWEWMEEDGVYVKRIGPESHFPSQYNGQREKYRAEKKVISLEQRRRELFEATGDARWLEGVGTEG